MVMNKKYNCFGVLVLILASVAKAWSGAPSKSLPVYIGVIGGYGSTTWDGLVPSGGNKNSAMSMSTPVEVNEGGAVWGALIGYEVNPFFAIEANYMRYSTADVIFDAESLFAFTHDDTTRFSSHTDAYSLMGKIMINVGSTRLKAYSSAGIANLRREDMLLDEQRLSPTFEVGFIYPFATHFMAEIVGNYTAGFGESQLNPADSYFPFLYSVTARLAYHF